jgi:bifunctional oligoribonuclease and PAP phosphatase NrnA
LIPSGVNKIAEEIWEILEKAPRIILTTHTDPDGDALGSITAMYAVLRGVLDKPVEMIATGKIPEALRFLPYYFKIHDGFDPEPDDVAMILDCGGWSRTGLFDGDELIIDWPQKVVVIDHHVIQGRTPGVHLIDGSASSTAELVAGLFKEWGIHVTRDIATSLLTGILFDTGSFKHANTTQSALETAGELAAKGADLQQIVQPLFLDKSVAQLKLWGRVLSSMKYDEDRKITTSYVTREDLEELGLSDGDLSGVTNLMNTIPELKFSLLLTEQLDNSLRGSFRTEDDAVDVARLAKLLGGGGHRKAAGFSLPKE